MISRRKAQMHEECVIKDCVKILSETSRLDTMRCQRLVRIGYTMEEFRNEFGLQDCRYGGVQKASEHRDDKKKQKEQGKKKSQEKRVEGKQS